jgi:hypothetical protein
MTFRALTYCFAALAVVAAYWPRKSDAPEEVHDEPDPSQLRVSRRQIGKFEEIRFRGSYDDVMAALNPSHVQEERPGVPADLDISTLPKYFGGCPHCRKMSMCGEGQWRYQELQRTRGYLDNTTTYLVCCKKCRGWMRATVDHDD